MNGCYVISYRFFHETETKCRCNFKKTLRLLRFSPQAKRIKQANQSHCGIESVYEHKMSSSLPECVHQRKLKYWLSPVHPPSASRPIRSISSRQSCHCEAALRNRAEPTALARHTVSGRFISTHASKSLQRFSFVSGHRSTLHCLLRLLKSRDVLSIDVDGEMLQTSQQSRVIGLIMCCVSTSCSILCVCRGGGGGHRGCE